MWRDAEEALDKAKAGEPLDSFQAEDLTLDQGIEDISSSGAGADMVSTIGAYLQASIAMSWASRRLSGSLRDEALELAEEYFDEGAKQRNWWPFAGHSDDPGDIAVVNLEVQGKLRSLSDRAGFPVRGGDLSYLLSMYGDTEARAVGGSPATKVDVAAIAEEQELSHQRSIAGIIGGTVGATAEDISCTAEVAKGLFTGKKPLSCDPDGSLMNRWGLYKWGFRIAIGLIIVGYAGGAVKNITEVFRDDDD
jgi:hypothetical protein